MFSVESQLTFFYQQSKPEQMTEAYWKEFKRRKSGETKSSLQTMTTKNTHELCLVIDSRAREHLNHLQISHGLNILKGVVPEIRHNGTTAVFELRSPRRGLVTSIC